MVNRALRRIRRENRTATAAIADVRAEHRVKARAREALRRVGPRFVGFVPCTAGGQDFVMFTANDDRVAHEYLYFGDDAFETEIVHDWISWARRSAVAYDIGSFTGLMSVLAARVNPRLSVHTFEPLERTVERAHINLVANRVARNVTLHPVAASDTDATATIHLRRGEDFLGTGGSLYDKTQHHPMQPAAATRQVRTARLDTLLPDGRPDMVKIDVEGHELAALHGLEQTIRRSRPIMVVEVWPHTRDEVLDLLARWGYRTTPYERDTSAVTNYRCEPD